MLTTFIVYLDLLFIVIIRLSQFVNLRFAPVLGERKRERGGEGEREREREREREKRICFKMRECVHLCFVNIYTCIQYFVCYIRA